FKVQTGDTWMGPVEIVGVVGNTKYQSLTDSTPSVVYYPHSQQDASITNRVFELRTDGPPVALAPAVKSIIGEFDSKISLDLQTIERQLDDSMAVTRAIALLSGFFGALALVLASIGLYGIMAYNVARRHNEIGVRIALEAEFGRVVRMVLGEVGRIVIAGVVIGSALSLATTRLITAFIYGIKPTDPTTFVGSAVLLLAVGILAAALPAWRAARLDPVAALREE